MGIPLTSLPKTFSPSLSYLIYLYLHPPCFWFSIKSIYDIGCDTVHPIAKNVAEYLCIECILKCLIIMPNEIYSVYFRYIVLNIIGFIIL